MISSQREEPGGERASVVLVIDDDGDSREVMCELLKSAGHRSVGAPDGASALEYLRVNPPPAAIVLDMLMPGMDGWQFRRAQERTPALASIPVILVSGLGVAKKNALAWGASAFVIKPFKPDELLGAVAQAVFR